MRILTAECQLRVLIHCETWEITCEWQEIMMQICLLSNELWQTVKSVKTN